MKGSMRKVLDEGVLHQVLVEHISFEHGRSLRLSNKIRRSKEVLNSLDLAYRKRTEYLPFPRNLLHEFTLITLTFAHWLFCCY